MSKKRKDEDPTPEDRSKVAAFNARIQAASMTPAQRTERAKKAAQARWKKVKKAIKDRMLGPPAMVDGDIGM